jgi:hypothetical protein
VAAARRGRPVDGRYVRRGANGIDMVVLSNPPATRSCGDSPARCAASAGSSRCTRPSRSPTRLEAGCRSRQSQLLRRHFEVEYELIHTHPWLESVRLIASAWAIAPLPGLAVRLQSRPCIASSNRHVAKADRLESGACARSGGVRL